MATDTVQYHLKACHGSYEKEFKNWKFWMLNSMENDRNQINLF